MRKHLSFRITKNRLHIVLEADGASLLLGLAKEFTEGLEFALAETRLLADAEEAVRRQNEEIAQREAKWARIGVQLYRFYRRSQAPKTGKSKQATLKLMAETYSLEPLIVEHLLSKRRRKVTAYVEKRRFEAVKRLYLARKTNAQIASETGLNSNKVGRIIREVRSKK